MVDGLNILNISTAFTATYVSDQRRACALIDAAAAVLSGIQFLIDHRMRVGFRAHGAAAALADPSAT